MMNTRNTKRGERNGSRKPTSPRKCKKSVAKKQTVRQGRKNWARKHPTQKLRHEGKQPARVVRDSERESGKERQDEIVPYEEAFEEIYNEIVPDEEAFEEICNEIVTYEEAFEDTFKIFTNDMTEKKLFVKSIDEVKFRRSERSLEAGGTKAEQVNVNSNRARWGKELRSTPFSTWVDNSKLKVHNLKLRVGNVPLQTMVNLINVKASHRREYKGWKKITKTKTYFNIANEGEVTDKAQWNMIKYNELGSRAINSFLLRVGQQCFNDKTLTNEKLTVSPGFLVTEEESFQPVHFDFEKIPKRINDRPFILHLPLCREGMKLNVVIVKGRRLYPISLRIPFGSFVLTRADVLHGGCYGGKGNMRFHSIILKVALKYDKLSFVSNLNKVELTEEKFHGNQIAVCKEDPNFVTDLLKAGKDVCMTKEDLDCIQL